jgi:hypothetical protein
MTKAQRADGARKRRESNVEGARARRRLSSAVDARRRLNASHANTASSPVPERDRGRSRYAYLSDPHD